MKYKNAAKERKFIYINGEREWVQPDAVVDLKPADVRDLGRNAAYFKPTNADAPITVAKTEVPAEETEAPQTSEKDLRKALKAELEDLTKTELVEVAEKCEAEFKSKANKDAVIKAILKVGKANGFGTIVV